MTNADLFRAVFNGLMATELWAKPESEFLEWLNAEAVPNETLRHEIVWCKDCKYSGHCDTEDLHRLTQQDDWFCADGQRR